MGKTAIVTEMRKARTKESKLREIVRNFSRDRYLYVMTAVGIVWFVLFQYVPMYGIIVAFKRFDIVGGIWRSPWVGFHNFQLFFESPYFFRSIRNTVLLGFYSIVWGFWTPIALALLLNEVRSSVYKRFVQTISYLPHFIAIVIIVGIMRDLFSHNGLVNHVLKIFGRPPIYFFSRPEWFRPLYIGSSIWQSVGFSSIIYLAVISGINPELYECAAIEGANRFHMVRFITLPALLPTMMILLILSTIRIINVGFEKVYLMYSPAIYETADVIQTYVYRVGLEGGQISFSSAVGLFNSVIALLFMVTVNWIARRVSTYSLW